MTALRDGRVEANGLAFPTLEAGPADGPLVLCLHGFPDTPRTWRLLLPQLAAAGYRAVAPTMRGYAPAAIPPDGNYQYAALGRDALAIATALKADTMSVIGHDWGALAAIGAAVIAPNRVHRLVTIALPHPTLGVALFSNTAQQKRFWYFFFFHLPIAEDVVMADDLAFIDRLWADWSPGYELPGDEREALKRALREPGVIEGALGYYRAAFDASKRDPDLAADQAKIEAPTVIVATLHLHGIDDGCAGVETTEGMEAFYPAGLRKVLIEHAGHFVHLEEPARVHGEIIEFLRS